MQLKTKTRTKVPEREKEFKFTMLHFDKLRNEAKEYSGIHVTDDKYEMYYARLAKRLRKLKLDNFDDYIKQVEKDPIEFKEFINSITTNVTSFNREPYHFDFLKEHIKSGTIQSLSIWSAGCSSGEEPYSIIINLYELSQQYHIPLNILATDLDTDVLKRAANGVYPIKAIENYSKDVKRKFFLKGVGQQDGFCRVKKQFRKMVTFKQLNLIKDWRFEKAFDIIFCRNVMIYFEPEMKKQIIHKYAEQLVPHGFLFLGHSESVSKSNTDFGNVGKTIYRKL